MGNSQNYGPLLAMGDITGTKMGPSFRELPIQGFRVGEVLGR